MPARTPSPVPTRPLNPYERAVARERAGLSPKWMVAAGETEFARLLKAEGVTEQEAAGSARVREWVRRNHGRYWVPAGLLEKMGIQDEEVG
jgi:hypothetical protein